MPGVIYASRGDPKGISLLSVILKSLKSSSTAETPDKTPLEASDSSSIKESHLLQLHKRLGDKSLDYDERAQIAVEVRQCLKDFETNCIPAVWYSAHDLIGPSVPQGTRRCAFELLAECIDESQDPAVRRAFFHIVMIILARSFESDTEKLDPHISLILTCLRSLLDAAFPLDDDDAAFLRDTIEDIIDISARDENYQEASKVRELLLIAPILKKTIQDDSLLKLFDLLSTALDPSLSPGFDLSASALDFVLYLTQEHEELLNLHGIRRSVTVLSRIASEPDNETIMERLKYVLHQIAQSPCYSAFLEALFRNSKSKGADQCKVLELYPLILVDNLCRYGETAEDLDVEREINHILDTLHRMKKDKEMLQILTLLLRRRKKKEQPEIATYILSQERLWTLTRSALVRTADDATSKRFIESVLEMSTITEAPLFSASLDELIQFLCTLPITDLASGILKLIEARRANLEDYKTLENISNRALSPNASVPTRIELYKLLTVLVADSAFKPLRTSANLFDIVFKVYNKSKDHDMNNEEYSLFQNFLYDCLRALQMADFNCLITEHIVPDVQAILAQRKRRRSIVNTLGGFGRSKQPIEQILQRADVLVKSCVKTFIWSATDLTGDKCILLFNSLCLIYSSAEKCSHSPASLAIARAMIRIRKSTHGYFYFTIPIEAIGISAAFGRLREHAECSDETNKWTFPESVEYIDESLLGKPNKNVEFAVNDEDQEIKINIGNWLSLAIGSIKALTDWELHSYLLAHLCSQLSEIRLLLGHYDLIEDFKDVICDHLTRSNPLPIELSEEVSQSDLHSAYVRSISSVLAYHPFRQKKFADDLISALVVGLKSWEKTLIPILHILTVSCFEVPLSIQKCLTHLLTQIQMRMTNSHAIPSVLEFLLALRNSPRVISNLTIDELRRVFGIVFKLIENSVDLGIRSKLDAENDEGPESAVSLPHNQEYDIEISPSTESFSIKESMVIFLQYQSFEVLSSWFCSLNMDRMKELLPFIMHNLRKLEKVEGLKYDALAHMDFAQRCQFIVQPHWGLAVGEDEDAEWSRWTGDSTLISIRSSAPYVALVRVWRPTCTLSFEYKPRLGLSQPSYDVFGLRNDKGTEVAAPDEFLSPEAVLPQLAYCLGISDISQERLLPIPDNVNIDRSIYTLDRLPNKEFQKTGIIYIGKNQDNEAQVLGNTTGSHQYNWFLDQMGDFIKLSEKPKLQYTGGLEDETDGEFALIWSDEISQIAFHTITLMPHTTDLTLKKRHVGNNFVNIFYNESDLPHFNFNIIKSQFTFISIVITPQSAPDDDEIAEHYKIKLYRRTGTPALLSCAHFKILTKNNLARYVRHVSQIANALAEKTHQRHPLDACSAWGARYKHLNRIRERVAALNATDSDR